jgi:uncharacterized SAM-binding protein YcdF (DUF218 family)
MAERVVAVLGYSGRDTSRLHPICAVRLAHAERIAGGGQAVILSGWARRNGGTSEAELMRAAWREQDAVLHVDRTARSTAGNATNVAAAAEALGADELLVVTSGWHRPRTRILFRAALRGRRVRLRVEGAPGPRPAAVVVRELVCLAFVPFQLWQVRRLAKTDALQPPAAAGNLARSTRN